MFIVVTTVYPHDNIVTTCYTNNVFQKLIFHYSASLLYCYTTTAVHYTVYCMLYATSILHFVCLLQLARENNTILKVKTSDCNYTKYSMCNRHSRTLVYCLSVSQSVSQSVRTTKLHYRHSQQSSCDVKGSA